MSLAPLTAARSRPAKVTSAGGSRRWTARQEREEQERFV